MARTHFPVSDHCDGERFFNPTGRIQRSFFDLLRWQLSGQRARWPDNVQNKGLPRPAFSTREQDLHLTFINHVTFLIQTNGLNLLTDPVFSLRASPSQRIGPKRVRAPGMGLGALPKIDAILISHNHYDHMDLTSLGYLYRRDRPQVFVPLGNARALAGGGIKQVHELDWWEQASLPKQTEIHLTPAQHWSGRGLSDRNRALWGGFVIQSSAGRRVFFAGDTGYGGHFARIRDHFGRMDLSLLPIGAYEPRWFMKEQHMNPEEAVQAHLDLMSKMSVGTHFGTFQLTDEAIDAPVMALEQAKRDLRVESFTVLEVGETRTF